MSLLELTDVDTYYGQIHILQELSLRIEAGELVCLLGGNASGKSTTLKTIIGLVQPRSGTIELDAVDTYYGQIHILQGLSISIRAGELVCLLGGNASGKSTTLKTILGIVRPRNGSVRIDGEDVTKRPTSYRIGCGLAIVP